MLPEHGHIHVSTPALFFTLLFVAAIVTVVFAFVRSMKRDRRLAELRAAELAALAARFPQHSALTRDGHWPADANPVTTRVGTEQSGADLYYHRPRFSQPAPVYVAPVAAPAYGMSPGLALAEGMLIGEALGSHHNTVVNETFVGGNDIGVVYDDAPDFEPAGGIDLDW